MVSSFAFTDEIVKLNWSHTGKAYLKHFLVVLFIMLHKVNSRFESDDEILKRVHSNEAFEEHRPVLLFIMLYNVFASVVKIPKYDYSSETFWEVRSLVAVYCVVQGGYGIISNWKNKFARISQYLKEKIKQLTRT